MTLTGKGKVPKPYTIILETKRLRLRHFVLDDLDALFMLYSDPEIRRYFPEGVENLEETKEELEWHMNGSPEYPQLGLWATIHKQNGRLIGPVDCSRGKLMASSKSKLPTCLTSHSGTRVSRRKPHRASLNMASKRCMQPVLSV